MASAQLRAVDHCPDASHDFIGNLCLARNDHPLVKAEDDGAIGGTPQLVVLRLKEALPKCKNTSDSAFYAVFSRWRAWLC